MNSFRRGGGSRRSRSTGAPNAVLHASHTMKPIPASLSTRNASGNALASTATPEAASVIQVRLATQTPTAGIMAAQKP
jgi:hypothetical protein